MLVCQRVEMLTSDASEAVGLNAFSIGFFRCLSRVRVAPRTASSWLLSFSDMGRYPAVKIKI